MIVEILGIPRCGKSTITQSIPHWSILEEKFDLNPFPRQLHDEYNRWYAQYITSLIETLDKERKYLIHRGVYDRIAVSTALYRMELISKESFHEHLGILTPHLSRIDSIVYVSCSTQTSLMRDTPSLSITGNKDFLNNLQTAYTELLQFKDHVEISTDTHTISQAREKATQFLMR